MSYLILILFFCIKAFVPQYGFAMMPLLMFFIVKYYKNSLFFVYYILLVLVCNDFISGYILLFCNISLIFYELKENLKCSKVFFIFVAALVALLIITFYHYNSKNDLIRIALIFATFGLLTLKSKSFDLKLVNKYIYRIYIITIIAQLINTYLTHISDFRGSIFAGTENIGIVIFLILLFYIIFNKEEQKKKKLISIFFYLFYLLTTGSRTIILILMILIFIYFKFVPFKKFILVLGISAIALFILFANNKSFILQKFARIDTSLEIISQNGGINVANADNIDIRAILYKDAIGKIAKKPILGWGVVMPDVFLSKQQGGMSSFHSSLADILVTYGLLGAIILLFAIYLLIKSMKTDDNQFLNYTVVSIIILSIIQPIFFNIQVMSLLCILLYVNKIKFSLIPATI